MIVCFLKLKAKMSETVSRIIQESFKAKNVLKNQEAWKISLIIMK